MSSPTQGQAQAASAQVHDDHAAGHGSGHGAALGPIDWKAWLAGVAGVVLGLVVIAAMLVRPA